MKTPNRQRILYAEDDQDSCEMVTVMCRFSDIDVVTANTVGDAWQRAQSEQFDLYLLDSLFPDGDGLELCRRLHEYAPHTPILIYSGNAYESDKKNGLAAGASEYLTKPYMADLAVTIKQNIEERIVSERRMQTSNTLELSKKTNANGKLKFFPQ